MQRKSHITSNLEKLPDDILENGLLESLDLKEIIKTAQTSKYHYTLFKNQLDATRLIHYVTHGKQEQAENLLTELKDQKMIDHLLSQKIDVTDIARRKFKKITAFQYTLWALDRHMWDMLLKYLSADLARSQLKEWEKKGMTYTKPVLADQKEETIVGEKHFDFLPLENAMQGYIHHFEERSWQEREIYWSKNVGMAQKNLPAHVTAEYCRLDRSFSPTPSFEDLTLPRQDTFHNLVSNTHDWFDADLGDKFAIIRGAHDKAYSYPAPLAPQLFPAQDLEAIIALQKTRKNELTILKAKLFTSTREYPIPSPR